MLYENIIKFAPIVLFTYNRPWHTRQTVEALQKNELAQDSELFIYSDASKNEKDYLNVQEVRQYLKNIKGFKSITIIERKKNFGLAENIISGVTNIVNKYGKIIVLEDDLVTSTYFLRFMNEALALYEKDKKVACISGYIYPIDNLPQTFFIKGADCWGWATWKRAWNIFESDGQKLLDEIKEKKVKREFDFNNSYNFYKMLKMQIKGKNNSWAVRWYASAFIKNMFTLYPGESYVRNIGFGENATHCKTEINIFDVDLCNQKFSLKKTSIEENNKAKKLMEKYFKRLNANLVKKVISRIKNSFL